MKKALLALTLVFVTGSLAQAYPYYYRHHRHHHHHRGGIHIGPGGVWIH